MASYALYVTNVGKDVAGQSALLWAQTINAIAPESVSIVYIESIMAQKGLSVQTIRTAYPWLKGSPTLAVAPKPNLLDFLYGNDAIEHLIALKSQIELSRQTAPHLQASGSIPSTSAGSAIPSAASSLPGFSAPVPSAHTGGSGAIDFGSLPEQGGSSGADTAQSKRSESERLFHEAEMARRQTLPPLM